MIFSSKLERDAYLHSIGNLDDTIVAFDLDGTLCKNPSKAFLYEIIKHPIKNINKKLIHCGKKMLKEYFSGNDNRIQSELFIDYLNEDSVRDNICEFFTPEYVQESIYPGVVNTLEKIPNKVVITKNADYIAQKYRKPLGLKKDEMITERFYKSELVDDLFDGYKNIVNISDSDPIFIEKTKKYADKNKKISTTMNITDSLSIPVHPYDVSMLPDYRNFITNQPSMLPNPCMA